MSGIFRFSYNDTSLNHNIWRVNFSTLEVDLNSLEVLRDNKKGIASLYNNLFGYLKQVADTQGSEVSAQEPRIEDAAGEFSTLGILRFNVQKSWGTYLLGYSDPNFLKIWQEIFPPKVAEANSNVKSHEFELMKQYFVALDPEFKALGLTIDTKTAVLQEGEAIGDWKTLTVDQVIKLPVGTKSGDLVFEIPLINIEYAKQRTLDLYGFREEARILVVDDSMVSRKHSRNCLAMAGYFNIEECPDGQAALSKVMGSRPGFELVVADWHMPVMSGFELLKKIRALEEFKKLPVIMVTGEKNKDEVVNAIKEGATGYLVKPVALPNFLKSLKKTGGRA